ncbi:rna-binding protein, partial [Moniliophthora roreri]
SVPNNPCFLERRIFVERIGKHVVRDAVTEISDKESEPRCRLQQRLVLPNFSSSLPPSSRL